MINQIEGTGEEEMLDLSGNEWLFYGGIAIMAVSAALATVSVVFFGITGKRLKKDLEQEYGEVGQ